MGRFCIVIFFFLSLFHSNSFAQDKKDKPREGEGIHAFLRRNKCTNTGDYNKFMELNKGKFGKNNSLIKDRAYILPNPSDKKQTSTATTSTTKNTSTSSGKKIGSKHKNKFFGKKYEEYTIKSNKLSRACFYLSSGHGGPDPGAVGKVNGHELHEDEYAYDITLRLARALMEEGATVHMIIQDAQDGIRDDMYLANSKRETCMGKAIPLNQVERLKQRSNKINELDKKAKDKYKRAVFIHLDSRSKKKQLDVFFYYAKGSKSGRKLASTMKGTFNEQYNKHQPSRGFTGTISEGNVYVLNNTTPVGLFAELGNIQNTFDQRRFLQYDNRQALANWMCRGLIKDYENWKKESLKK
jgi:N-acetylmuramoyl-L-alanine amidase